MKQIAHETDGLIFQPAGDADVYKSGIFSKVHSKKKLIFS